jgi:hypothetical protein
MCTDFGGLVGHILNWIHFHGVIMYSVRKITINIYHIFIPHVDSFQPLVQPSLPPRTVRSQLSADSFTCLLDIR